MKLDRSWPCVAGMHAEGNGDIAVVWLARDTSTDRVYLYDSALFKREVLGLIAKSIKEKGAWVPLAWEQDAAEIAGKLKADGCKTISEGYKETQALAEVNSREIWERIRTKRFMVGRANEEWWTERKRFAYLDGKVPQEGFPLMSATRHAVSQLKRAKVKEPDRRPIQYDTRGII